MVNAEKTKNAVNVENAVNAENAKSFKNSEQCSMNMPKMQKILKTLKV